MDWLPSAPALAITCAALLFICVVLAFVLWSTKHHRDPHIHVKCEAGIDALVPSLAALSHGMEVGGNSVEILRNGEFFDVVMEEISKAKKSIHFESFLWKQGKLGKRLVEAFCERARAGVTVGVINHRDHRKILLVDGKTAFVGGHCIVDEWMGEGDDKDHYRDISVRLRGPRGPPGAVGLQRELGWSNRRALRGRGLLPEDRGVRRPEGARGARDARRLGPGGEDPAPHGDLHRDQAAMDPESLLPAGARGDRGDGRGREAWRGRARNGALGRSLRHAPCTSSRTTSTTSGTRCSRVAGGGRMPCTWVRHVGLG